MSDCPAIPLDPYSSFSKRVFGDVINKRLPLIGALELTMRCNLRCVHCFCDGHQPGKELSIDEYRQLIDQLATAGCMWLLVTGGEPLMRRDFMEIYSLLRQRGILPVLFTNATLVTTDLASFIAEWRPFNLEVSVYGASSKTYEQITGVAGSFDRCMAGIENLLAAGLQPRLKTMVMGDNLDEIDALYDLAASYGLPFRFDPLLNATLGNGLAPTALRVPPETVVALDCRYRDRRDTWTEFIDKFGDNPPSETYYSCGAGINAFHIDPYGRLYPCTLARDEYFDLRRGSFGEGWNGIIRELRSRRPDKPHRCGSCSLRSLCGCCPGRASLETGDPGGSIEYLCRVASLRAQEFGNTAIKEAGLVLQESLDR